MNKLLLTLFYALNSNRLFCARDGWYAIQDEDGFLMPWTLSQSREDAIDSHFSATKWAKREAAGAKVVNVKLVIDEGEKP